MVAPPIISGAQCQKALEKLGYREVRRKGSHVRLNCDGRAPVTVPMHDEIDRNTLRSILKTAGISVDDLVKLL